MKFYSSEPNLLREELTRYQFFLQLKQDILDGKLECPENVTIELSALALQCESFFCSVYIQYILLNSRFTRPQARDLSKD